MQIVFYCEHGEIEEVGTGHYWRTKAIGKELSNRGHSTKWIGSDDDIDADVLVIDDVRKQTDIILRAKDAGTKVMLIDGVAEDVPLVDASISAIFNDAAKHTGIGYMAFPKCSALERYRPDTKHTNIFVGLGGFDARNLAEKVLKILDKMKVNAIVAKSINHPDFREQFGRVEIFDEENYYNAFHESIIGITNGGLTLFQAMHYGLPCIAMAQYPHQQRNIDKVAGSCISIGSDEGIIETEVSALLRSELQRKYLSSRAQQVVDGRGIDRICSIIEELR